MMVRATPGEVLRVLAECEEKGVSPLGEVLRRHGSVLPDQFRRGLALSVDGPSLVVCGSRLGELIQAGTLSEDVIKALHVALFLQEVREVEGQRKSPGPNPTDALRELRDGLQTFRAMLAAHWPNMRLKLQHALIGAAEVPPLSEKVPQDDPDLEAIARLLRRVEAYLEAIEAAERDVQEAGFVFDWETGRLKIPPGPRGGGVHYALRVIVKAFEPLLLGMPTAKAEEEIARELAPFFGDLGSRLHETVKNVLKK